MNSANNAQRWCSKADALIRLAEDQRGKPEGGLAREMLLKIINNHPEAFAYEPILDFCEREFTMADVGEMKRRGISTDGRWTAGSLEEAIALMIADYQRRMALNLDAEIMGQRMTVTLTGEMTKLDNNLAEIEQMLGLAPLLE